MVRRYSREQYEDYRRWRNAINRQYLNWMHRHPRCFRITSLARKYKLITFMLLVIICLIYLLFGSKSASRAPKSYEFSNLPNEQPVSDEHVENPVVSRPISSTAIKTKSYYIPDLYSSPTNPPQPPRSNIYDELTNDQIVKFWGMVSENDRFDESNMPTADSTGSVYLNNYIFSPYEQMITIFLLTADGLRDGKSYGTKISDKYPDEIPEVYANLKNTIYEKYRETAPFACVFRVHDTLWISEVDFVPHGTTIDANVNGMTEIMRCHVPMEEMQDIFGNDEGLFFDPDYHFQFLLTQKWWAIEVTKSALNGGYKRESPKMGHVHMLLTFIMGQRSGIKIETQKPFVLERDFKNAFSQRRTLAMCVSPVKDVMHWTAEHIAHHIENLGIEHVYIGTHFGTEQVEEKRAKLMRLIKPWYDRGLVTIWYNTHRWMEWAWYQQTSWIQECLYYSKTTDDFVISIDFDEFLVPAVSVVSDGYGYGYEDTDWDQDRETDTETNEHTFDQQYLHRVLLNQQDRYCWFSVQSSPASVIRAGDEEAQYVVKRWTGVYPETDRHQDKIIWNTKHLHFTGVHGGGSCTVQGRDWSEPVGDWKLDCCDDKVMFSSKYEVQLSEEGFKDAEKYVFHFHPENELVLWHYNNIHRGRLTGPNDRKSHWIWDNRMADLYWNNIKRAMETYDLPASFPEDEEREPSCCVGSQEEDD